MDLSASEDSPDCNYGLGTTTINRKTAQGEGLNNLWRSKWSSIARVLISHHPEQELTILRGYIRCQHPDLPIIALSNHRPVSLDLYRTEVFAFNGRTPSSGRPHLFAIHA